MFTSFFLIVSMLAAADIVFLSDRDGKSNVYVMNDNGSNVRQITSTPFSKGNLRWSPDGQQFLYAPDLNSEDHRQQQQIDIFMINAGGAGERNLTEHPALDTTSCWSPDGTHIVFSSSRGGGWELYRMEIATREVRQLTRLGFASAPDWSPNGKNIVFTRQSQGIYTMRADGKHDRPLLRRPRKGRFGTSIMMSGFPRWSPDGKHILYSEAEYVPNRLLATSILIVNVRTRHVRGLDTPKGWTINKVCWADDGDAVLFAGGAEGFG